MDLSIQYSGVPIRNGAGEIVGAMEIVTDQTDLKRAMQRLGGEGRIPQQRSHPR